MFDTQKNRYITKGVNEQVPKKVQLCWWQMIDEKVKQSDVQMDYLQIDDIFRITI